MKTPYFLIKEDELKKNINEFKYALEECWPNSILSYSVKTNSLPWVLKYLKSYNVYAEVVSDEEYELAKLCGYDDNKIVFNGPIKTAGQLEIALKSSAIVNIDSKNDLLVMEKNRISNCKRIGIRLNVDTTFFNSDDIGYVEEGFRFGFSEENDELVNAINSIKEMYGEDARFGIHLHCNSVTRSLDVYKSIAKYAVYIIRKYDLNPSFIDVGGGFFGGVEGKPSAKDYISTIKDILSSIVDISQTTLILEPGSAIIGSVVDLYTSVIDVKSIKNARIITTDGSRIHIDPLWSKSKYMYTINAKKQDIDRDIQIICGYTCMDHDRIMTLENEKKLSVGDSIIYHRVGAYSITFGGMFIRYYPDVYVLHNDYNEKIRERISVENYFKIHYVQSKE